MIEIMCPICRKWHNGRIDKSGRAEITCSTTHVKLRFPKVATELMFSNNAMRSFNAVGPRGTTK